MKRLEPRRVAFCEGQFSVTESGLAVIDPLVSIYKGNQKGKKWRKSVGAEKKP